MIEQFALLKKTKKKYIYKIYNSFSSIILMKMLKEHQKNNKIKIKHFKPKQAN